MINKFLTAKHWQLFLLTFALPLIFQIGILGTIFSNLLRDRTPEPITLYRYFAFFPLLMMLLVLIFHGWIWSVGVGLQKKLPEHLKSKTSLFKWIITIPTIYFLLMAIGIGYILTSTIQYGTVGNNSIYPKSMVLYLLLYLLSMGCIFYSIYFAARTIKMVELKRKVTFKEFVGEFFMIGFYPIGIWFLQPKINELIKT